MTYASFDSNSELGAFRNHDWNGEEGRARSCQISGENLSCGITARHAMCEAS
jgi:hypothetical protein